MKIVKKRILCILLVILSSFSLYCDTKPAAVKPVENEEKVRFKDKDFFDEIAITFNIPYGQNTEINGVYLRRPN